MLARHRLVTLLALAGALAGTTGSAAAADRVVDTYDMTYTGTASHAKHDLPPGQGGTANWDWEVGFSWKATAAGVQLDDGELVGTPKAPATVTIDHAASEFTWVTPSSTTTGACSGATVDDPGEGALFSKRGADGTYVMGWDPLDAVSVHMTGCSGAFDGVPLDLQLGDGEGLGAQWTLPPDAQRAGQVIVPVHQSEDAACPMRMPWTASCEWSFTGQVTLTRTGHEVIRDTTAPPATQPQQPPASGPTGDPDVDKAIEIINQDLQDHPTGDEDVDVVVRTINHYLEGERAKGHIKATVTGHGAKARVEVPCPSTCSGTVSAYGATGPRSNGQLSALAVARFRMATGAARRTAVAAASRTVATLRFSRAAQRTLRKRGWVALRIAMKIGGAPSTQRTTITVKVKR